MNFIQKKAFLLFLSGLPLFSGLLAQCAEDWALTQWSRRLPGDPYGANAPFQVAVGGDGAIYMAGYASDSLFLQSADGAEVMVAGLVDTAFQLAVSKYSPDGVLLWAKGFEVGPYASFAPDVIAVGEEVFVSGTFFGSLRADGNEWTAGPRYGAFVARLGPDGALRWVRTFSGTGNIWGYGLAALHAGRVFLTGRVSGPIEELGFDVTGGSLQFTHSFVLSLDGDGVLEWASRSGPWEGAGHDSRGHPITGLPGGGVAVGGFFSDSLCWDTVCITSGRNGGRTPYIAQLDGQSGALSWLKGAEPLPQEFPNGALYGLAADGHGNLYGAGFIQSGFSWEGVLLEPSGNFENTVLSWDEDGVLRWAITFGSDNENDLEWASAAKVSPYQTLMVSAQVFPGAEVGGIAIPSRGGSDVALLEFTLQGEYLRHWTIGGEGTEFSYGAALGPGGTIAVCGNTQSQALFFRAETVEMDTAQRANSFLHSLCLSRPPESRDGAGGEVLVFPNPSWGVCWIEGDFSEGALVVGVFSPAGQILQQEIISVWPGRRQYPVNLGDLPPGVYYLRIAGEECIFSIPVFLSK